MILIMTVSTHSQSVSPFVQINDHLKQSQVPLIYVAWYTVFRLLCFTFLSGDGYLSSGRSDCRERLHDDRAMIQTGPLRFCSQYAV